jgi:hypothetical protein
MDSAMNEEVNFCSQCGVKVNSGAKFCLSCGYDIKNSSTKITSDKPIKVEVTNVTVEKGFKAVENGFKSIQEGFNSTGKSLMNVFKTKEKTVKTPEKYDLKPEEFGLKDVFKVSEETLNSYRETPYMIDDGCPNCGTSITKEINFNNCRIIDISTCPRCKSPLPEKLKSILRDQHSKKSSEGTLRSTDNIKKKNLTIVDLDREE